MENKTPSKNKLKTIPELSRIVADLKKKGKTVGLVTGCFDVIHIGHIELLTFAKSKVNVSVLVVGLENDETIKLSES